MIPREAWNGPKLNQGIPVCRFTLSGVSVGFCDNVNLGTYDCHEVVEDEHDCYSEEVEDVVLEYEVQEWDPVVDAWLLRCVCKRLVQDKCEEVDFEHRCCNLFEF